MAMSVATKLQSPICEPRAILGPGGNRVRVSEDPKRKGEALRKPQKTTTTTVTRKPVTEVPQTVVRNNASVDSSCSSDSSSSGSLVKTVSSKKTLRRKGMRPAKIVPDSVEVAGTTSPKILGPPKRCDWITPNSDPIYTLFHDEEWGVPVHEDNKLFELLVFSQALAELTWPAILKKRDLFRKLFEDFDPSSVAQFSEKKLLSLKVNGYLVLSEPKLRAVVENAKQVLKVQKELGSFSSYCWGFVNHKPIRNGFRYARQVPVKSPKADLISKDMMQRGFRCVGPTVIYSFMQVAGIVNDHLLNCFRHEECNLNVKKDLKPKTEEEPERPSDQVLEKKTCLSDD
ncbi:hypothetical protein F8388_015056 [Cannabis sativa]|uniref:DNA-3-methyladenine glycosylase I n=1 Tax=Cannabis sativa TaxID=3483 RepID=A0A7J6EMT1_CANSA|nr:hypothetical protein G4B88_005565 [Cannabis sativa]KAF4359009.1 hypothetical protein F8388_015056 [Cannabis sativa]